MWSVVIILEKLVKQEKSLRYCFTEYYSDLVRIIQSDVVSSKALTEFGITRKVTSRLLYTILHCIDQM